MIADLDADLGSLFISFSTFFEIIIWSRYCWSFCLREPFFTSIPLDSLFMFFFEYYFLYFPNSWTSKKSASPGEGASIAWRQIHESGNDLVDWEEDKAGVSSEGVYWEPWLSGFIELHISIGWCPDSPVSYIGVPLETFVTWASTYGVEFFPLPNFAVTLFSASHSGVVRIFS